MKEIINLQRMKDFNVEGRVCINYTDPLTSKIKEQVKGTNHIFKDSLFCANWANNLNSMGLHITDSIRAIDVNFPYMLGTHTAWGSVGSGSSGIYKGAYNTELSYLAKSTIDSVSWKYVYDFTPTQALGKIGTIGLTKQYDYPTYNALSVDHPINNSGWRVPTTDFEKSSSGYVSSDGRYFYSIASTRIIYITDAWTGSVVTIDVSSIVTGTSYNYIAYAPQTGYFYIFSYTAKMVWVFSDGTFSNLLTSYPISNFSWNTSRSSLYVYDDILYIVNSNSTKPMMRFDFIKNTVMTNITLSIDTFATNARWGYYAICHGPLLICCGYDRDCGFIFDMATETCAGFLSQARDDEYSLIAHPISANTLYGSKVNYTSGNLYNQQNQFVSNCAVALYKVPNDAPERPAGYGMTITYELEVVY